jgi:hypothetical protein
MKKLLIGLFFIAILIASNTPSKAQNTFSEIIVVETQMRHTLHETQTEGKKAPKPETVISSTLPEGTFVGEIKYKNKDIRPQQLELGIHKNVVGSNLFAFIDFRFFEDGNLTLSGNTINEEDMILEESPDSIDDGIMVIVTKKIARIVSFDDRTIQVKIFMVIEEIYPLTSSVLEQEIGSGILIRQ